MGWQMGKRLKDDEIIALKSVPKILLKPLRQKWIDQLKFRQLSIELCSQDQKHRFKLYMRQSNLDEDNFSCGLSYLESNESDITLARYNGSSHVHVNKCDGQRFDFQCHIHQANEASLKVSKKIENFAIQTDRYKNLSGAIQCVLKDFNIIDINIGQLIEQGGLFDEN